MDSKAEFREVFIRQPPSTRSITTRDSRQVEQPYWRDVDVPVISISSN